MGFNRLLFRRTLIALWVTAAGFGLAADALDAAGHINLDAARREGKVMLYSSIGLDDVNVLAKAFEKKYPWLQLQTYRAGKIKLAQRMVTEARAGKHQFDVLLSSAFTTLEMKLQKLLSRYESPERSHYRSELKDSEGYWTGAQINTMSVSYNTKMVKREEVPQRWQDLLHPRWRGKIAINGNRPEWFIGLLQFMGEEEGRKYMRALVDNKTIPVESSTLAEELLGAGEFPVYANATPSTTERIKRKGAPVEWARVKPLPTYPILVSVAAHTKSPNSAKLLADYLLSEEGQAVLRDIPRIPARSGMESKPAHLTKGVDIFYINIGAMAGKGDDMEEDFRKTFNLR
jgi:iron(III) transport system substrate-binding protein